MNFSFKQISQLTQILALALVAAWCTTLISQEANAQDNLSPLQDPNQLNKYREAASKWNDHVARLAATNDRDGSEDTILCIGSSSFRLWDTIDADMKPYRVVRRAYGGAKFCDLAIHAPNLISGLRFRAALVFVANDISGSETDKTPQEIKRLAEIVVRALQTERPEAHVFLVAITPTPSRFQHWNKIQEANKSLQDISRSMSNVHFIDTVEFYLTNGKPRTELFVKDMLHQNSLGYQQWARLLSEALDRSLKQN